jgi:hypothetical protein
MGDRMMIRCVGGSNAWRATTFPPPVEFEVDDGVYVLVDEGPPDTWAYEFVADRVRR